MSKQTFDGEEGTYSDYKCSTCKPATTIKLLTPVERCVLFHDILHGHADIVYAREESDGFVYMTIKKSKPFFTDLMLERLR